MDEECDRAACVGDDGYPRFPRTLAMTLYGDLDVSVIDELPPGRKPIQTLHRYDNKKAQLYEFLRKEIQKGRQVYVVYPLIEGNEKLDYKDLEAGLRRSRRSSQNIRYVWYMAV